MQLLMKTEMMERWREFGLEVRNEKGQMLVIFCNKMKIVATNTRSNMKNKKIHTEEAWRHWKIPILHFSETQIL